MNGGEGHTLDAALRGLITQIQALIPEIYAAIDRRNGTPAVPPRKPLRIMHGGGPSALGLGEPASAAPALAPARAVARTDLQPASRGDRQPVARSDRQPVARSGRQPVAG